MMSGGIGSWATARRVIAQHGTASTVLLFADTKVEDPDLYRFLDEAAAQLGAQLVRVADGRTPWEVFRDKRMIGNSRIAPCSKYLKQVPCRQWLETHTDPGTATVYVGIDWTETHRLPAIEAAYLPWTARAPLCEPPYASKDELIAEANAVGLATPRLYELGFPHNNCGGACVRGGQAQWTRLHQVDPERFATEAAQEQQLRAQLGKDVAILRDRTGGITKPLPLIELRQRIARGQVDTDDWGGCGCFTEIEKEVPVEKPDRGQLASVHPLQPPTSFATPATPTTAALRTSWTADELMAMTFPETKWAVPGVIAEGLNLLAGPPKVGKSWLSLGTAIAVAGGGKALEAIEVEPGPVLYLALEDTPRRLQNRMGKILQGKPAPKDLTLATSCPTLPQGGEQAIARWLERNVGARMVVIDVFAKVRGTTPPGLSAYDADYAAMGHAKRLADTFGVAVVLVHHVRKMGSDDFLEQVSGTNGLAGAADATLVLKRARGTADGVLHVTGRDVEEDEYAMAFQPAAGLWRLMDGPPEDHQLGETRAAIARYLRTNPNSPPKEIAEAIGRTRDTVKRTCARMAQDSQLCVDAAGRYRLPGTESPGAVPAVPAVPEPPSTSDNATILRGQSALLGVPAVPDKERPQP
ncbi:AAA family ATPase [Nonomuraea sp. bgisy101]|uniref:AAA family ATPase n=1 Tax=Nonomuraea sp. bgisy101 TaxID=3413784 RepID=UPI003D7227E1